MRTGLTCNDNQPVPTGQRLPAAMFTGSLPFVVAAAFVLPFLWFTHTWPIHSFFNEWIAAVLMLAAAVVSAFIAVRHRGEDYGLPVVALLFAGLAAVIGLQYGLGMYSYSSTALLPALTLLLATVAAVTGGCCAARLGLERLLVPICAAAIAGGVLNVLLQVLQLLGNSGIDLLPLLRFRTGGSLYGALAQQNHLSTYLCWALIATLYLHARGRLAAWLMLPLVVLFLAGLTMTTSRMSWLQVACIAIAGCLFARRMDPAARPRRWILLAGLPLCYLAVSLLLPQLLELAGVQPMRSSLARISNEEIGGPRRLLIEQAWAIFLAHPVLGVGPGQFNFHQFMLDGRMDGVQFASSPHNLLFDLLSMTGLTGTILFLAILLPALARILRSARSPESVCCVLMLAVFGIHTLLEYPQWYAYFLLPAAFLFGALETRFIRIGQNLVTRVVPAVAVLYGLALSIVLLTQYLQLETLYLRHYVKNRLVNTVDSKAVAQIEAFAGHTLFTGPAEYLLCFNFYLNEIALERKLAISSRAVRHLAEPNIVYRHVILLALSGRQEEGIDFMQRLKKTSPREYDEVAAEMQRLAATQPAFFGRIAAALEAGKAAAS